MEKGEYDFQYRLEGFKGFQVHLFRLFSSSYFLFLSCSCFSLSSSFLVSFLFAQAQILALLKLY